MVKIGFIVCSKYGDTFWKIKDLVTPKAGAGVFASIGPAELVGCVTCGGCPGKKIADRAKLLTKCGADIIAFSSRISNIDADGSTCPYDKPIMKELSKQLQSAIVIDCHNGVSS